LKSAIVPITTIPTASGILKTTSCTIAGDNPARVVRERFDAATVQRLLEIAWWDRPAEWIGRHLDLIRGADVDALYAATR